MSWNPYDIVWAILIPLILNLILELFLPELKDWLLPRLPRWLVRLASRWIPEPSRKRYEEEWCADLEQVPGTASKLLWAILILLQAPLAARAQRRILRLIKAEAERRPLLRMHSRRLRRRRRRLREVTFGRLTRDLLRLTTWIVPKGHRARYHREFQNDLWYLDKGILQRFRFAVRVFARAFDLRRAWLGLPSWSSVVHRLRRLEPILVGTLAGGAVFLTLMLMRGATPTLRPTLLALAAGALTGVKEGMQWHRNHPYQPHDDELEAFEEEDDDDDGDGSPPPTSRAS